MRIDKSLFLVQVEQKQFCLWSIFIPIYLETLLNCTLGTVNTALISAVSESVVGAIGAANQLLDMYNTVFSVIVMGETAAVSNYLGAKREREAEGAATVALVFSAGLALSIGILLCVLRAQMLKMMHIEPLLLPYAETYYSLRTVFLIFPTMTAVINALMRCHGASSASVISGLCSNAVNLIGSFLSVTFLRAELSTMILGISLSCVAGQIGGFCCALLLFRNCRIRLLWPKKYLCWLHELAMMLRAGVPGAISTMGYTISQTVTTAMIGSLGQTCLSAKVFYSTVSFYCCMFSSSMGNANSVMVGYLCGQGAYERAMRLCRTLTRLTCAINLTMSCLLWLLRRQILSLFTEQESILLLATAIFAIDIVVEQARARSQIYEYALRATGDTFWSMLGILASCWINGVGVAYLLGICGGLGLIGIWIAFALDELCRALVTYTRWRSKKWQKINRSLLHVKQT